MFPTFFHFLSDLMKNIGMYKIKKKTKCQLYLIIHHETSKKNTTRPNKNMTCTREKLPVFINPYMYIDNGYRTASNIQQCIKSMFEWNNETLNIYTEIGMIPFILLILVYSPYPARWNNPGFSTWSVFIYYFLLLHAFVFRPLCSSFAHLFYSISENWYRRCWCLDYASIIVLIVLFGLWWDDYLYNKIQSSATLNIFQLLFMQDLGWIVMNLVLGIMILFNSSDKRAMNFCMIAIFLRTMTSIICQVSFTYSFPLLVIIIGGIVLLMAFCIKLSCVPERWFPNKCNMLGSSHMFWHIFLNLGIGVMSFGMWHAL
jgi:adiponectin receptor